MFARSLSFSLHRLGNIAGELVGAHLVGVGDRLHLNEVDDSGEVAFGADRELNWDRVGAETIDHRLYALGEVCSGAVHLVDVGDPRHGVLVGLAPDSFGLRLNAGYRVKKGDCAVEHTQ